MSINRGDRSWTIPSPSSSLMMARTGLSLVKRPSWGPFVNFVGQAEEVLEDLSATTIIPTIRIPDGVTSLGIYLTTRVVELVVHGDDLASSVGLDWQPSFEAGALAIGLLVQIASEQNGAVEVLRVLARSERAGSDVFPVL